MATDLTPALQEDRKVEVRYRGGSGDAVYGLGLIGAWIFYIGRAKTFQEGAIGFLKGLVWPAFMVYEVFEYLRRE
jgi:phage gp29-like protein